MGGDGGGEDGERAGSLGVGVGPGSEVLVLPEFVLGMRPSVQRKLAGVSERTCAVADPADVRPLLRVAEAVLPQILRQPKFLPAIPTQKWLIVAVDCLVSLQGELGSEYLTAARLSAGKNCAP